MAATNQNITKPASKGKSVLKKMLDDKKAISTHLSKGGALSDLKGKYKFVNPL